MTNYILTFFVLVSIFYTATKTAGWLVDVFVAKFIANEKSLERAVSNLISQTSLRWGGIENDKNYSVTTKGYVVTVKKNRKDNK